MPPNAKTLSDDGWLSAVLTMNTDLAASSSATIMQLPPVIERSRSSGPGYLAQVLSSPKGSPPPKRKKHSDAYPKVTTDLYLDRVAKESRLTVPSTLSLQAADSTGSNFHSMDGLAASFPLARKEAKERLKARYNLLKKKEKRSRKKEETPFFLANSTCGVGCGETISPTPSRESHRLELRQELLQLKLQIRELRKHKKHSVRFAAPLVTETRYRPYTDARDIPELFFQEEELDLLEEDRDSDTGDVVECEFVEAVRAVSVACMKRASIDD